MAKELSPGEIKVKEYVARIQGGEPKDAVLEGLPESFRVGIEAGLSTKPKEEYEVNQEMAADQREVAEGIPPQYRGFDSETLDFIWTIPEYVDRDQTLKRQRVKAEALAKLRAKEEAAAAEEEKRIDTEKRIAVLKSELKIPGTTAPKEAGKNNRPTGWEASYELAKIAASQNIDLSALSREEYVDFAIQNSQAIDDDQLRMAPWHRMATSIEEIVAKRKENRAKIDEKTEQAFSTKFAYEIKQKAVSADRYIEKNIRVRSGTEKSQSWLYFAINKGAEDKAKETYKSYISVKNLSLLTPEAFTSYMRALRDAGYNGDVKSFQEMASQGVALNDQIVMHGASERDALLALQVAEKFFGDNLDKKSLGKDEMVDGENLSYSQVLARKIAQAVNKSK
ncbi:MAG TPA: hypothetical protein VJG48_03160 [Candidatus Paceibacterota bacterium]